MDKVAPAPIYRPTEEQWRDPLAYIRSIQAEAAQSGICIVRAPLAPTVPGGLVSGQPQAAGIGVMWLVERWVDRMGACNRRTR